jgi:hypothetical protein
MSYVMFDQHSNLLLGKFFPLNGKTETSIVVVGKFWKRFCRSFDWGKTKAKKYIHIFELKTNRKQIHVTTFHYLLLLYLFYSKVNVTTFAHWLTSGVNPIKYFSSWIFIFVANKFCNFIVTALFFNVTNRESLIAKIRKQRKTKFNKIESRFICWCCFVFAASCYWLILIIQYSIAHLI